MDYQDKIHNKKIINNNYIIQIYNITYMNKILRKVLAALLYYLNISLRKWLLFSFSRNENEPVRTCYQRINLLNYLKE